MLPLLLRSPNQQEAKCEAFLSFLFYAVGLLLPMWLLVRTEPPASLHAWEQRSRRSGRPLYTSDAAHQSSGGSPGCRLDIYNQINTE